MEVEVIDDRERIAALLDNTVTVLRDLADNFDAMHRILSTDQPSLLDEDTQVRWAQ
jgi:hypothetical protein